MNQATSRLSCREVGLIQVAGVQSHENQIISKQFWLLIGLPKIGTAACLANDQAQHVLPFWQHPPGNFSQSVKLMRLAYLSR